MIFNIYFYIYIFDVIINYLLIDFMVFFLFFEFVFLVCFVGEVRRVDSSVAVLFFILLLLFGVEVVVLDMGFFLIEIVFCRVDC